MNSQTKTARELVAGTKWEAPSYFEEIEIAGTKFHVRNAQKGMSKIMHFALILVEPVAKDGGKRPIRSVNASMKEALEAQGFEFIQDGEFGYWGKREVVEA